MRDVYAGDEDPPLAADGGEVVRIEIRGDAEPSLLGRIAAILAQGNDVPERVLFERRGATCRVEVVLPVGRPSAADLIARKLAQLTTVVRVEAAGGRVRAPGEPR